uniref:Glycosyltransferase family 92 protein n=2 Tax=Meloidogyne incognita group TaxID=654580 RepID=A0A914LJ68_MELIC
MILNKAYFQKVRRIITRAFLFGFLFILCITFNMPWSTQHIAIISTNYFFNSSSYPSNTMVVLFNAQRRFWPPWPLLCHSHNTTHSLTSLPRVRHAFTPILICGWSVFLAVCPTVQSPSQFALRDMHVHSNSVAVPYRKVSAEHLPVVACFSPLFFNERWQLIIPTLEIYRQYGVSLQVFYIQSMLVEILDFMRIYENEKIIRIEAWTKFNISMPVDGSFKPLDYDPNAELEWRNQAAAHTDCLIYYKVSYNRYNTHLITSNDPKDFSLLSLINGARIAEEWEDPKYVVKPQNVQSVWLHWPGIVDKGRMYLVPDSQNFILHFRNWSMIDHDAINVPLINRVFKMFNYQISDIIRPEATTKLENNFRKFILTTPHLAEKFSQLPHRVIYYPIISACYNRIFYGRSKRPMNCPGPLRCLLPSIPDIKCAIGIRHYEHGAINEHVVRSF